MCEHRRFIYKHPARVNTANKQTMQNYGQSLRSHWFRNCVYITRTIHLGGSMQFWKHRNQNLQSPSSSPPLSLSNPPSLSRFPTSKLPEIISFVFPGLVNRITSQLSNQNYPDVVSYYDDCLSPPHRSPRVRESGKWEMGPGVRLGRSFRTGCSLKAVSAQEPSVLPQWQSRIEWVTTCN